MELEPTSLSIGLQAVQQLEKPVVVSAHEQQAVQEPPPRVVPMAAAVPSSASSAGSEADGGAGALLLHGRVERHGALPTGGGSSLGCYATLQTSSEHLEAFSLLLHCSTSA
jgi:hypothetical protein